MKKYRQKISDNKIGDCFRTCMATILQLPPEVLPNDHSPGWYLVWEAFLKQFGLNISFGGRRDAIWLDCLWIASVKSLNYKETSHAIIMDGTRVFHDPSNKKRYKAGRMMLSNDRITGGYHLYITDATLLHRLEEYRQKINKV